MVVRAPEDAKPDMSARFLTVTLQIGQLVPHPRCPGPNGAPGPWGPAGPLPSLAAEPALAPVAVAVAGAELAAGGAACDVPDCAGAPLPPC
jgi:hypothetical protein